MRDMKPCQHALSDDVIYKEVVVIGNGPSGMVTSFMLAGNVPYLKEIPEDLPIDDMLRARLSNLPSGQNLLETDLMELAEGLEGRSQNPIPLLIDNLLRPCADMGIQADSLIEWRYDAEKQVEHVVLGSGPPGGAWHSFARGVRTLSPAAWLALPPHAAAGPAPRARLPAAAVAAYCTRYVHSCRLQRYFRSGAVVSSVQRAPSLAPPCGPACPRAAAYLVSGYDKCEGRGFRYLCRRVVLACGGSDRPNVLAPHLARHTLASLTALERAAAVLAAADDYPADIMVVGSGVSAADAVLGARRARPGGPGGGGGAGGPGGTATVRHVHRAPPDALARLSPAAYPDYCHVYKMMCDGPSGNHPNYTPYPEHVIVEITPIPTKQPQLDDKQLQRAICPKRVKLLNLVTNETIELTVSIIAVLIGSKPDLFFLQTNFNLNSIDVKNCKCVEKNTQEEKRQNFLRNHWHYLKSVVGQSIQSCKSRYLNSEINGNDTKCIMPACNESREEKKSTCECQPTNPYSSGLGFGLDPEKPVDGRSNPIAIDKSTHEMLNAPKGMYALGPLTADNFVRFIPGGAFALVSHIHRDLKATVE